MKHSYLIRKYVHRSIYGCTKYGLLSVGTILWYLQKTWIQANHHLDGHVEKEHGGVHSMV